MAHKGQKGLDRQELADRTITWTHMLYQAFGGIGTAERFSVPLWYELAGKPADYTEAAFNRTARVLRFLDILRTERPTPNVSLWTLLVPEEDAKPKITKFFLDGGVMATEAELRSLETARLRRMGRTPNPDAVEKASSRGIPDQPVRPVAGDSRGPKFHEAAQRLAAKPAIATSPAEEVRAIAGPEPEKPFAALAPLRPETINPVVEQARIYANRHKAIEATLDVQEKLASNLGVKFDRAAASAAFVIETDPRMEMIMEVLPYITTLEQRVERLTEENTELRKYKRDYGAIQNERDRLSEQNRRLIAAKVTVAQPSSRA